MLVLLHLPLARWSLHTGQRMDPLRISTRRRTRVPGQLRLHQTRSPLSFRGGAFDQWCPLLSRDEGRVVREGEMANKNMIPN